MRRERYSMQISRRQKLFGVGPVGALLSLLVLGALGWLDHLAGRPVLTENSGALWTITVAFIVAGVGLHVWSFRTLRNWLVAE